MKKALMVAILTGISSVAAADSISDGGFDAGTTLTPIGKDEHDRWDSTVHQLNQWYTWEDKKDGPFHVVNPQGWVEVDRTVWDDDAPPGNSVFSASGDVIPAKLLQVIEAPDPGDYLFSFNYDLTDEGRQYSLVRVVGIGGVGVDGFTIRMDKWQPVVGNAQDTSLYDQGDFQSVLPGVDGWTPVESPILVTEDYDYLAIYAVFSYDGLSKTLDSARLDDFALTSLDIGGGRPMDGDVPEPATLGLVGVGLAGLVGYRRRRIG